MNPTFLIDRRYRNDICPSFYFKAEIQVDHSSKVNIEMEEAADVTRYLQQRFQLTT
ncbi:MAG: hypothetical protein ACI88H_000659 [Cocleimonas sp.]|jgi:hypothetical protein